MLSRRFGLECRLRRGSTKKFKSTLSVSVEKHSESGAGRDDEKRDDEKRDNEKRDEPQRIDRIEEEDEQGSERSSKTSVSLSSISISQNGARMKRPDDEQSIASRRSTLRGVPIPRASGGRSHGYPHASFDRTSEVSMQQHAEERHCATRQRSPVRSYVTHLTEEDD